MKTEHNVIVPYTPEGIHRALDDALRQQMVWPRYIDMTYRRYYAVLGEEWDRALAEGKGLIIVEHDNLPWPGAIDQLAGCRRGWCALPYYDLAHLRYPLGCVKLSNRVLERTRVIWTHEHTDWWLQASGSKKDPRDDWQPVDLYVQDCFRRLRLRLHRHGPPILHMHEMHWTLAARLDSGRVSSPRYG